MSQPSANVDAVIFCWAQAELAALAPAAIHQRDCFAAAWSPSASEALFVSNHLQVCIGAKLTASLQLTDTDWSRAFKALCRSEMESLRLAGQQALQKSGSTELWKSSHLDIAKTVVAAQSEMARRLDDKDWILQGLRRNGMLAYRPDLTLQKLVPLSDDDCGGQAMGFLSSAQTFFFFLEVSTPQFFPKLQQVTLVFLSPDWSAVAGAKAVSDLVEWNYWNPADSEEPEPLLSVAELPEDLQLPCLESGVLTLSLDLRRQATASCEKLDKLLAKRSEKALLKRAKKHLRGKLAEGLRARLKTMSRKQLLTRLIPRAGEKPSATRKAVLKNSKKQAALKALKDLKKSGEASDKGEPAALSEFAGEQAATLPGADKGPLFGKVCRVLLENNNCSKTGKASAHNLLSSTVTLTGCLDVMWRNQLLNPKP